MPHHLPMLPGTSSRHPSTKDSQLQMLRMQPRAKRRLPRSPCQLRFSPSGAGTAAAWGHTTKSSAAVRSTLPAVRATLRRASRRRRSRTQAGAGAPAGCCGCCGRALHRLEAARTADARDARERFGRRVRDAPILLPLLAGLGVQVHFGARHGQTILVDASMGMPGRTRSAHL